MNRCARVHPVFVLFFLLLMVQVRAKEAGLLDRSFDPGTGADSDIRALLVYPTGEALIGGAFTNFDGRGRAGIARLLPAGVLDTSFDTGAGIGGVGHWQSGRAVEALAVQTDGKVIAGGAFTEFNGQLHLRLARLDATGVPDPGFNATVTDASDPVAPVHNGAFSSAVRVRALAIDQKGRILIGGVFTYVNGVARPNLARLNPDGSTDEDFALDSPFSYNDEVVFVHLREDGRILIGGALRAPSFDANQFARVAVARLEPDGRLDPSFQVNLPFGFVANSLAPVSSGQALVGGYLMDGQPNQTALLYRITLDGSSEPELVCKMPGVIDSLVAASDGAVLMGGAIEIVAGHRRHGLARLLPNGTLDFCYQTGASIQKSFADAFPEVRSLAPQGGGILVAGNFTAVDGVTRRGIARLRSEPNCSTGTIQFSASVLRFSDDCGNALITIDRSDVGNDSVGVELEAQSLDALGNPSSPLHLPVVFEPGERVKTVELPISLGIAKDGEKSIPLTLRNPTGGAELGAVINALLHIVHAPLLEIISTPDPNFVPFEVEHGFMDSVVVQADGKLLVRGSSVSNEGVGASYLVRLLPDGGLDPSFTVGSHADQYPVALAVTPDNKIILGGGSSAGGGAADAWLVRLDQSGNLDREFHPKLEPQIRLGIAYSTVSQVVVQPDQKVLAMGSFTVTEAGQTERTLARFNPDGSVDRGFAPQLEGLDWGWSMTLLPDGKLMILVSKASAGCSSCYELLRLQSDGALDATFTAAYVNFSPSYQPDGKWLLPGLRATPALDLSPLALRLNADGSLDSSLAWTFDPAGSDIRSAAAQSDMKILLSGFYSSVNGVSRPGLARLHPDGHFDYGFSPKLVDQSPVREGYASRMSFFLPLDDETALAITTTSNDGVTASFSAKLNRYKLVSTNRAATIFISNLRREFKENVTNALVSIVREGDATAAAEARFETIDRSARAGRDYIAQSKTIRFEPGEREKVVPIPLLDNARVDDNRNFTVALSGPAQAVLGTPAQIEVSILDDDHLVEFDSPQYTVDELGRFLLLRVRRYGVATGSFTVDYFTRPVNAAAGVDFTPQSGTIAFGASWFSTNAFIQIPIRDDALVEGDETFQVVLANPSNLVKLGPNAAATVTIRDNDGSFGPGRGVEGIVWALAEQPDETVLVAGQFSSLNGTRRHAIGRLNPDGSLDEHFRGPFAEPDIVTRVAVDSEGRILVVGIFRQMEGRDQQFVRLLQDGNLDHSFAANVEPGFPANTNWFTFPNILAVAAQADGRIVMGGYFTSVNGSNRLGLARLDRNGALDATFSPKAQLQSPNWLGDYVSSIIVQPDNRLLIGGSFRTAEWGARNGLVRLQADGSLDESFTPDLYGGDSLPGEWPNRVRQLALQTDGKILVLREFNQPSLVRLNPDGSRDASFTAQLWPPPFSIGLDAQGKVLVGGYQQMLWLDRNGSPDPTVAPGPLDSGLDFLPVVLSTPFPVTYFPYPTSGVATFCLRRNGRILLGGSFINVQDQTRTGMAELIRDGSLADSLRLYAPVTGSGNLLLRGVAPVGAQIWLEKSSDLVSWTLLDQFQSKDGPFELKDTGPAADGRAFYRLLRK